ncbi:nuclear transport factor 2 family protein [Bacteroidota bacterium]
MIDTLFTDDGVYEDVHDDRVYKGKEEIKKYLSTMFTYAPDTKIEWGKTYKSDNWAVAEWTWKDTQTGDIEGLIEATGKPFTIKGITVYEFKDGKIKRNTDYYNPGGFLYQLGIKFIFPSGKIIHLSE